ncbi:hypothetical protein [Actinokineospora bangkokensis]|uniref:Acyl-protein synthetase LuxE domain-containing protein n=1 Tax=Actinokineospora bangkokensis TaxID=1193682 RepID=A0A1Q9LKF0_9PSEU|nr:hypothetical protein [Actinokineospora bangkokensis]OLR92459.1 hypothetical protein BJP25_20490 [Actinokineospora bangkokensis]
MTPRTTTAGTTTAGTTTASDARSFADDPLTWAGGDYRALHRLGSTELAELQLAALRERFADLRERVEVLGATVADTGVAELHELDDVVPLLFSPQVYKSYPSVLLRRKRFDVLTAWLGRLTTVDVSGADTAAGSVDDWLASLDEHTDLRVQHSSVTSGTMSFVPHTHAEVDAMFAVVGARVRGGGDPVPVVWPMIRHGRSGIMRCADALAAHVAGGEHNVHAMHPGRMSADVMLLAGQLAAARARGEAVEADPDLLARRAEFERLRRESEAAMPAFAERLADTLAGERVYLMNTWNTLHQLATAGLDAGRTGVFAADSLVEPGGGTKGAHMPDDWQDRVRRFTGADRLQHIYAMTETTALHPMCPSGRYHLEPWTIAFVLDPATDRPLPRTGTRTGRGAFVDLLARTHWGGFRSEDRITVAFDPCDCGRATPQVHDGIRRLADLPDGDKINCAATDSAHRAALDHLTGEG